MSLHKAIDAEGAGQDEQWGDFAPIRIHSFARVSIIEIPVYDVAFAILRPGLKDVVAQELKGTANDALNVDAENATVT